jgi:hypothetical protein
MKKAFTRYGLLGLAALLLLSIGMMLSAARQASAQGGGVNDFAVVHGPIQISNEQGQRVQLNVFLYGPGRGTRPAETVFDVTINTMSPTGPQAIRKTVVFPHVLEVTGRICRLSLVHNGDNFDLYQDGMLVRARALNGLPPGIPWEEGIMVNSHTTAWDRAPDSQVLLSGTMQVVDNSGNTTAYGKSHELAGNVTLYK